jgi:hypothetical protein
MEEYGRRAKAESVQPSTSVYHFDGTLIFNA